MSAALLLPALVSAQTTDIPGFNVERLELNPSAVGSLVLDTPRLLPEGDFRFQAVGHYERDPLLVLRNGTLMAAAIQNRATLHVTGDYALKSWLEIGLQVPVVLFQDSLNLNAVNLTAPALAGLGTPVVTGRLGLLSSQGAGIIHPGENDPVDVAFQAGLGLNVGSAPALARDPSLGVQAKLLVGRQVKDLLVAGELSGLFRQSQTLGVEQVGNQLNFGVSVARVGHPLGGEVTVRSAVPLTRADTNLEVLGGLRYRFTPILEAFAVAGWGIGTLPGTPTWRGLLGIAYASPETAPKPEVAVAEPPPPVKPECQPGQTHKPADCPDLDDDGDGVNNGEDFCPLDKGTADRQGCPEPDDDLDGTPDSQDRCPHEAGPPQNFGCPVQDRDRDGVPDVQDACPDEPGVPEARGCPIKDSDNDGVPDYKDNCPREPGPQENQGCPLKEKQLVEITKEKLEIKDKVYFAFDKAEVLPRSYPMLKQIAKILEEHPEIPAISIEGHTDNVGSANYNRKLSQARAESVRTYLISQGVPAQRLVAKGFGPDRPAATNDTEEGREKNRRVEFNIVPKAGSEGSGQPLPGGNQ